MEWYQVCWPLLTSKRVARVCQHQLSFLSSLAMAVTIITIHCACPPRHGHVLVGLFLSASDVVYYCTKFNISYTLNYTDPAKCVILYSVSSFEENTLLATTPPVTGRARGFPILLMTEDRRRIAIGRTFEYRSDPVFSDIRPRNHLNVWVLCMH